MEYLDRILPFSTRAYLFRVLLAASMVLGVHAKATDSEMALWVSLIAAILGNGIAVLNTETTRQWIYGIAFAAASLAVAYNFITEDESVLWVNLISALVGNGLATVNSLTKTNFNAIEATGRELRA